MVSLPSPGHRHLHAMQLRSSATLHQNLLQTCPRARTNQPEPGDRVTSSVMVRQTADELRAHIVEQMSFLEASAHLYDMGRTAEAKRLAVAIRVLFHTNRNRQGRVTSHGLVDQVMGLEQVRLLDTAGEADPFNLMPACLLTWMTMTVENGSVSAAYTAYLDTYPRGRIEPPQVLVAVEAKLGHPLAAPGTVRRFDDWWTTAVVRDDTGHPFSRRDLVLALANKDGGAHVDPDTGDAYGRLSRSNSLGWVLSADAGDALPLSSPVPSAVRQIAFEVLTSGPRFTVDA